MNTQSGFRHWCDVIASSTGGVLVGYFLVSALVTLATGQAPELAPGGDWLAQALPAPLLARVALAGAYVAAAALSFVGFRTLQELARGNDLKRAFDQACETPRIFR